MTKNLGKQELIASVSNFLAKKGFNYIEPLKKVKLKVSSFTETNSFEFFNGVK